MAEPQSQSDKFADLAREAEADLPAKAWDERLRKIAAQEPAPGRPA